MRKATQYRLVSFISTRIFILVWQINVHYLGTNDNIPYLGTTVNPKKMAECSRLDEAGLADSKLYRVVRENILPGKGTSMEVKLELFLTSSIICFDFR